MYLSRTVVVMASNKDGYHDWPRYGWQEPTKQVQDLAIVPGRLVYLRRETET